MAYTEASKPTLIKIEAIGEAAKEFTKVMKKASVDISKWTVVEPGTYTKHTSTSFDKAISTDELTSVLATYKSELREKMEKEILSSTWPPFSDETETKRKSPMRYKKFKIKAVELMKLITFGALMPNFVCVAGIPSDAVLVTISTDCDDVVNVLDAVFVFIYKHKSFNKVSVIEPIPVINVEYGTLQDMQNTIVEFDAELEKKLDAFDETYFLDIPKDCIIVKAADVEWIEMDISEAVKKGDFSWTLTSEEKPSPIWSGDIKETLTELEVTGSYDVVKKYITSKVTGLGFEKKE